MAAMSATPRSGSGVVEIAFESLPVLESSVRLQALAINDPLH